MTIVKAFVHFSKIGRTSRNLFPSSVGRCADRRVEEVRRHRRRRSRHRHLGLHVVQEIRLRRGSLHADRRGVPQGRGQEVDRLPRWTD